MNQKQITGRLVWIALTTVLVACAQPSPTPSSPMPDTPTAISTLRPTSSPSPLPPTTIPFGPVFIPADITVPEGASAWKLPDTFIYQATYAPDSKRLAIASSKGLLIYNASTLALETWLDNTGQVRNAAWSPDSSWIASGTEDGKVHIWNATSHEQAALLDTGSSRTIAALEWSPTGAWLAVVPASGHVQVWDASSGSLSIEMDRDRSRGITWSPDEKYLIVVESSYLTFWNTGTWAHESNHPRVGCEVSVVWSPDSKLAASGTAGCYFIEGVGNYDYSSQVGDVVISDADTGRERRILQGHDELVEAIDWSPDGAELITASADGSARVWNAETGSQIAVFQFAPYTCYIYSVSWSPDNEQVAISGFDGTLVLWTPSQLEAPVPMATPTLIPTSEIGQEEIGVPVALPLPDSASAYRLPGRYITQVVASPYSAQIAIVSGNEILVQYPWQTKASVIVRTSSMIQTVSWLAGGEQIAGALQDETIRVWDVETGEEVAQFSDKFQMDIFGYITQDLDWAFGGKYAASTPGGKLMIWDGHTGEIVQTTFGDPNTSSPHFSAPSWSPDGSMIAVGRSFGDVLVYNALSREFLGLAWAPGDSDWPPYSIDWSPDSSHLAGGYMENVFIWDPLTQENTITLRGHTETVLSVAWSFDGRLIASGGSDGTVRLWSTQTERAVATFDLSPYGHTVSSVTWTSTEPYLPDRYLVATTTDGVILAVNLVKWQIETQ